MICGERFYSVDELRKHIESIHCSDSSKATTLPRNRSPVGTFAEMGKNSAFVDTEDVKMTNKVCEEGKSELATSVECMNPLTCPVCDDDYFTSPEVLNIHINEHFSDASKEEIPSNDAYRDQILASSEYLHSWNIDSFSAWSQQRVVIRFCG